MRQVLLLSALAGLPLSAQFSDLAVTDDGRLYFATRLARAAENTRSKVYRVTGEGLELFRAGEGPGPTGTGAVLPLTSGDGSITGYGVETVCPNSFCGSQGSLQTVEYQFQGIAPGGIGTTTTGRFVVSRNGRYLLDASWNGRIIEVATLRMWKLPTLAGVGGQIANTGAVVIRETPPPTLLKYVLPGSEPRPIPGTESAMGFTLSPDGAIIAYERSIGNTRELVLTDPSGANHRVIASAPRAMAPVAFSASFANDGTLLYLAPEIEGTVQPMLLPAGGEARPLVITEHGVRTAILSGNGQIAWLVTNSGQLIRVRTADGGWDEFIPETPYLSQTYFFALPGSVIRAPGTGLSARTRFQHGDMPFPVTEVTQTAATVQVPWDLTGGTADGALIVQGPESPFRQEVRFAALSKPGITFERVPLTDHPQIAHQDFRGILTPEDPARPGETVHIFARNMGPVDRAIRTGEKSPTAPPARVTTPLACYLFEVGPSGFINPRGVEVPFAGLSGGSVGVYQIDVTIPENWAASKAQLLCKMESGEPAFSQDQALLDIGLPR